MEQELYAYRDMHQLQFDEYGRIVKNMSTTTKKNFDPVECPSHYAGTKIEVIDYIEDKNLGFCLGNAVKYISRAGHKQDYAGQDQIEKTIEDLKKAVWYLNRRIKELEDGLCD